MVVIDMKFEVRGWKASSHVSREDSESEAR